MITSSHVPYVIIHVLCTSALSRIILSWRQNIEILLFNNGDKFSEKYACLGFIKYKVVAFILLSGAWIHCLKFSTKVFIYSFYLQFKIESKEKYLANLSKVKKYLSFSGMMHKFCGNASFTTAKMFWKLLAVINKLMKSHKCLNKIWLQSAIHAWLYPHVPTYHALCIISACGKTMLKLDVKILKYNFLITYVGYLEKCVCAWALYPMAFK